MREGWKADQGGIPGGEDTPLPALLLHGMRLLVSVTEVRQDRAGHGQVNLIKRWDHDTRTRRNVLDSAIRVRGRKLSPVGFRVQHEVHDQLSDLGLNQGGPYGSVTLQC